jgi:hypothetical protein
VDSIAPIKRLKSNRFIKEKLMISITEFFVEFETFLQQECKNVLITKWDENAITHTIAKGFATRFSNLEISNLYPNPAKIKSIAYQQSGLNETSYGDLAF